MIEFRGQVILLDIEGTISTLAFVREVLFPYARREVAAFLQKNSHLEKVQANLNQMAQDDGATGFDQWCPAEWPSLEAQTWVVNKIYQWIDADVKLSGLKQLQGLIWEKGYRDGSFRAPLFPEVASKLNEWKACGLQIYIYSSGSVDAQKLFFAHTEQGNLTPLISGYFDTTIGPKRDQESYNAISEKLAIKPSNILFLSDIPEELNAAHAAGYATALVIRPGNKPITETTHQQIHSFEEILVADSVTNELA